MGMRTVNDPYGSPSVMVDAVFGASYNVVRNVANNIDFVKKVSSLFDANGAVVANLNHRFTAASGQNEFELPVPVISEKYVTVFVNNKWKSPVITFTVTGNILHFDQPLEEGDLVNVMILSGVTHDLLLDLSEATISARDAAVNAAAAVEEDRVQTSEDRAAAAASAEAANAAAEAAQNEADRAGEVDAKATSALRASGKTPQDFGAIGDGVTNDRTAFVDALADPSPLRAFDTFSVSGLSVPTKPVSGNATLLRSAAGNLMTGNATGARIEGWTFDMNRDEVTDDGQGLSLFGSDFRIQDAEVRGFSRMASGGGTGVLVYSPDLLNKSHRGWLENLTLIGHSESTAAETFGWILADADYSFVSHVYAENIFGNATAYGHELKNTASYNNLHALTTKHGIYGYGHGQQAVGLPGAVGNVGWGIVNAGCDRGVLVADGKWNLIGGSVTDWDNSPQKISRMGVYGSENEEGGLFPFHLVHGAGEGTGVHLRNATRRSYVSVALHTPDASKMVEFVHADTQGNMVDVLHTGTYTSVIPYIVDTTGNGLIGPNGNVVHSASTGERIGSRSGVFHDVLGWSGVASGSWLSAQGWRFESNNSIALAMATPTGQQVGMAHNTPARTRTGSFAHISNAIDTSEYWEMRTGGTNILRWFPSTMRAVVDAAYDLGNAAFRFKDIFVQSIRPGAGTAIWTSGTGTPEGNVTAPVGSLYTRTNGGTGTTLYVKETGTGNTGWVAK